MVFLDRLVSRIKIGIFSEEKCEMEVQNKSYY